MDAWGEHGRKAKIMLVLFQVAALLASAKLLGWAAERCGVPGVIGELLAGVIIGPYLLGHLIQLPLGHGHWAPLFPAPLPGSGEWPVNDIVWTLAQFASVILLFVTGLHTDLRQFFRYVGPATFIAFAGLVVPFALGVGVVAIPMFARLTTAGGGGEFPLVAALFVGAILAATSIGITARVLGDIGKLDTPEGVTIIGAAVVDDVLGIIALAIVGGIAAAGGVGGVSAGEIGLIAGKAFGFWIALTAAVLLLARRIEWALSKVRYGGAPLGLGLALAFVCSGAAESVGLAFIIGAYSVGLGLSQTKLARKLMEELESVNDFLVPVFFAALGMLVNIGATMASGPVILFGLVVTAAAIVGKLIGCGAAALPTGFNRRGAYRIGLGMMPRGEVALIVAGIGLSTGIIGEVVFGVSIMMTLITTVLAPILLVPAFAKGGDGRRVAPREGGKLPTVSTLPAFQLKLTPGMCRLFVDRLVERAESSGWEASYEQGEDDLYLLRSGDDAAEVSVAGQDGEGTVRVDASASRRDEWVGLVKRVQEEIAREATGVRLEVCEPDGPGNCEAPMTKPQ